MAKQIGIIPFQGSIDNITFFKSKDGYMVKKKSIINASTIAKSPSYARTRENMSEFGRAGKAAKVFRNAVNNLSRQSSDRRTGARLLQQMMRVLKADKTSLRGQRNVIDGEAELLKGFEFNIAATFKSSFTAKYTTAIDRVAGTLSVSIPSFVPLESMPVPTGTTHYRLISGGASIDFENEVYDTDTNDSGYLPLNGLDTDLIKLENKLTANSTHPLFLLLGIEFHQEANGLYYPLNDGEFNALSIVNVDGGV